MGRPPVQTALVRRRKRCQTQPRGCSLHGDGRFLHQPLCAPLSPTSWPDRLGPFPICPLVTPDTPPSFCRSVCLLSATAPNDSTTSSLQISSWPWGNTNRLWPTRLPGRWPGLGSGTASWVLPIPEPQGKPLVLPALAPPLQLAPTDWHWRRAGACDRQTHYTCNSRASPRPAPRAPLPWPPGRGGCEGAEQLG